MRARWPPEVDITDTDTGSTDHLEVYRRGDHFLVRPGGGTQRQAFVSADDVHQLRLLQTNAHIRVHAPAAEDFQGFGAQFVGNQNFRHSGSLFGILGG